MSDESEPKDPKFSSFMHTVTGGTGNGTPVELENRARQHLAWQHLRATLGSDDSKIVALEDKYGAALYDAIIRHHKSIGLHPDDGSRKGQEITESIIIKDSIPLVLDNITKELDNEKAKRTAFKFRDLVFVPPRYNQTEAFLEDTSRFSYKVGDFSPNIFSEGGKRWEMARAHLTKQLGHDMNGRSKLTMMGHEKNEGLIQPVMAMHYERGFKPSDSIETLRALFDEKLPKDILSGKQKKADIFQRKSLVEHSIKTGDGQAERS